MSSGHRPPTADALLHQISRDAPADTSMVSPVHAERVGTLFRDEHLKVVHYLVPRTGSWSEARDVAAQAFSQVLFMKDPGSIESLRPYLYRTARNIATDRLKISAIRRRLDNLVKYDLPDSFPSPEPDVFDQQREALLYRAVENLRPSWRLAVRLRFWEQLQYPDIVERFAQQGVKVDERTIRRWLAQAIEQCRSEIESAEGVGGRS